MGFRAKLGSFIVFSPVVGIVKVNLFNTPDDPKDPVAINDWDSRKREFKSRKRLEVKLLALHQADIPVEGGASLS